MLLEMKLTVALNPLSNNPTKWSNTLKQFVGNLPANCLSVFDHFVILVLKGLISRKNNGTPIFFFKRYFLFSEDLFQSYSMKHV